MLAFLAVLVLPTAAFSLGMAEHMEQSKTTGFCLSCHVMEPYGRSLFIDSPDHVPANHFQDKRVPRESACLICHTTYTMFGDLQAKLTGGKHLYVNYFGHHPGGALALPALPEPRMPILPRRGQIFDESDIHLDVRAELASNEISCLECHDLTLDVTELDGLEMWVSGSAE